MPDDPGSLRRVLLISPSFPPDRGGIERTAGELAAGLSHELEVTVIAGRPSSEQPGLRSPAGVRIHWTPNHPPHGRKATAALIAGGATRGSLLRPDVVLCLHIRGMPAARAIGRVTGARTVLVVHAKELAQQPRLARAAVRWADGIVTVSRFSRELALAAGAPEQRTTIIHPGVTPPSGPIVPVRDRPGPVTVLAVARLADRHKGHDLLIEAIHRLRERGRDVRCVIVGDGPLRPELQRLAADSGVGDLITFTGAVDDERLHRELAQSHVFCLPTRPPAGATVGEGFGISFIEAGAYGLPAVSSRVPGVVDAVQDGVTGTLLEPGDPAALASALERLTGDLSLATMLGEAGRERATELAWPNVVARYTKWFRHVSTLPRRRAGGPGVAWLLDLATGPRPTP